MADDHQWKSLCDLLDRPDWADYDTVDKRRAAADSIDAGIAEWVAPQTDADAVTQLLDAGVPASVVVLPAEINNHPQLRTRSFIEPIDHPVCGEVPCASLPFRFESSPAPGPRPRLPSLASTTARCWPVSWA